MGTHSYARDYVRDRAYADGRRLKDLWAELGWGANQFNGLIRTVRRGGRLPSDDDLMPLVDILPGASLDGLLSAFLLDSGRAPVGIAAELIELRDGLDDLRVDDRDFVVAQTRALIVHFRRAR